MDESDQLQVEQDMGELTRARAWVRSWCQRAGVDAVEAPLIASELLTNAIRHARSPVTLAMEADDVGLLVKVTDGSLDPPHTVEKPGVDGGYGLHVVAHVSRGWDWQPRPGGKVVWSELVTERAAPTRK